MKISAAFTAAAIAAASLIGLATSASAQATRTWVSGVGDDANPCSRTAPCKTFAGAIGKTAVGGMINCLDPGGYGIVSITKAITIDCAEVHSGIIAAGASGVLVNAGAQDVVVLRGLSFEGMNVGLNGVHFLGGAALHIEDCRIWGFRTTTPNGNGVLVNPSAGNAELYLTGSTIFGNGAATTGAGIEIAPTGSASVKAAIEESVIANNTMGVRAVSNATTGSVDVSIARSQISGGTYNGLAVQAATGSVSVMVNSTRIVNNANQGVRVIGANGTVRIGSSVISGNLGGLNAGSGGTIRSYGNNQLDGNGTDGAFTSLTVLK